MKRKGESPFPKTMCIACKTNEQSEVSADSHGGKPLRCCILCGSRSERKRGRGNKGKANAAQSGIYKEATTIKRLISEMGRYFSLRAALNRIPQVEQQKMR